MEEILALDLMNIYWLLGGCILATLILWIIGTAISKHEQDFRPLVFFIIVSIFPVTGIVRQSYCLTYRQVNAERYYLVNVKDWYTLEKK